MLVIMYLPIVTKSSYEGDHAIEGFLLGISKSSKSQPNVKSPNESLTDAWPPPPMPEINARSLTTIGSTSLKIYFFACPCALTEQLNYPIFSWACLQATCQTLPAFYIVRTVLPMPPFMFPSVVQRTRWTDGVTRRSLKYRKYQNIKTSTMVKISHAYRIRFVPYSCDMLTQSDRVWLNNYNVATHHKPVYL